MYEIENGEMHPNFPTCWRAAGIHLQNQVQGKLSWLKANHDGPSLEHLSFRLGNQLFFIPIEDDDGEVSGPGGVKGLLTIAHGCAGVPCIMPMRLRNAQWETTAPGWGLVHAETGTAVDPVALITEEKIEMTAWELQDFAVQVIRDHLRKQGKQVTSTQSNPSVDPSIWLAGEFGPEYVIVRSARHPASPPVLPQNLETIVESCSKLSRRGYFASVVVANSDDPFLPNVVSALPLWRGHALVVRFDGLKAI